MQRCEIGELLELRAYAVIDTDRAGKGASTVHDSVTDDLGLPPALQELG